MGLAQRLVGLELSPVLGTPVRDTRVWGGEAPPGESRSQERLGDLSGGGLTEGLRLQTLWLGGGNKMGTGGLGEALQEPPWDSLSLRPPSWLVMGHLFPARGRNHPLLEGGLASALTCAEVTLSQSQDPRALCVSPLILDLPPKSLLTARPEGWWPRGRGPESTSACVPARAAGVGDSGSEYRRRRGDLPALPGRPGDLSPHQHVSRPGLQVGGREAGDLSLHQRVSRPRLQVSGTAGPSTDAGEGTFLHYQVDPKVQNAGEGTFPHCHVDPQTAERGRGDLPPPPRRPQTAEP